MQSLEERVAYLEGQVNEHSHSMLEVRDAVRDLRSEEHTSELQSH